MRTLCLQVTGKQDEFKVKRYSLLRDKSGNTCSAAFKCVRERDLSLSPGEDKWHTTPV